MQKTNKISKRSLQAIRKTVWLALAYHQGTIFGNTLNLIDLFCLL